MEIERLEKLSKLIRYYILTMTTNAGSGHASSSLSAVELMAGLFFTRFRADLSNPQNPSNDRLIFSKGHASPLFYSLYAAAGKLSQKDLAGYRKFDSPLEGHPTLEFPYTESPTGSLGQGLSIGLGMAFALQRLFPKSLKDMPKVYVLLGDGETAEGSVWEAVSAASYHRVGNLVAILDVNRLGQSQPTMLEHNLSAYQKRFESFGWKTIVVKNGHDFKEVLSAYKKLDSLLGRGQPVAIIAKTYKGYGTKLLADKDNWHGKPLPKDLYLEAIKDLGKVDMEVRGRVGKPLVLSPRIPKLPKSLRLLKYKRGDEIATRQAAGDALTALMHKYPNVVTLDGDVKNSLYTESTQKAHPDRYFEMFIAEQNMVGTAVGMARRDFIPFVTTFSAFLTRAYDQIRMAALARANIKFIGSHAGVSIGEDGASQMGLEDLSMFRSILGSTVLYPADAVSSSKLIEEMIKVKGISYIRVGRPAAPVIYKNDEKFPIGGSKIHRLPPKLPRSLKGKIILIAAGVTLYESLKAQLELAKEGIEAVVVDCYSIKPIDSKTLKDLIPSGFARGPLANGVPIITVEDHWFEGGLGDAVLNVFANDDSYHFRKAIPIQERKANVKIHKLAVTRMPHSGKPAELLDFEGISAKAIVSKTREVLSKSQK